MARRDIVYARKSQITALGATELSGLSDVNTSTPTSGFVLVADGVDFESRALVEADISDLGTYLATVAVSDLDNGTDGELITWNSSGIATTVAVGTSGHVLTSNGAGAAPTFQAAAGGGGPTNWVDNGLAGDGLYNSLVAISTTTNGIDVTDVDGSTPQISGYTSGAVRTGQINFASPSNGMYFYNQVHGDISTLFGEDAGGTLTTEAIFDPDGSASLYHDGTLALNTHAGGIEVSDTSGGITSVRLMTDAAVQMASYWANSTGEVYLDSNNHGGNVNLRGEDALGTMRDLLIGDPDGSVDLYYDAGLVFETDDSGIHIYSSTGTTTTLRFFDNVATQKAVIFSGPTVAFSVRGSVSGGNVFLGGTDGGAANADLLDADPDGGLDLYYDNNLKFSTQLSGVRVYTQTGGAAAVEFTDATGASRYGRLVATSTSFSFGANGHGASVSVTSEDSGGTPTFLMSGDPDAAVDLYYDGSISISTEIGGASIYDTSGNDPRLLFLDDVGTQVGLIQCLSGASMRIRNSHISDPIALQATDSGSAITTVCEGDPNGSFDTYNDGTLRTSTTSTGLYVTAGGTTILDLESTGSTQDTSVQARSNTNGGWKLQWDESVSTMKLRQISVTGVHEDLWLTGVKNGEVELYYNGTGTLRTQSDKVQVAVGGTAWHDVPMELSVIKEATNGRTSTVTLADDGDFVFALPSTGWYAIEAFLRVTSTSATPDLKQAFAYSGTIVTGGYMFTGADNGAGTSSKDNAGVITTATVIDCDGSDANGITLKGWIEVSTTGNLSYQWSQNVSDATSIQLQAGSWMKVSYIGA